MAISPAVITSKPAQKAFMDIKTNHAELMKNMTAHAQRVDAVNRERNAENASKLSVQHEMDKAKATANTEAEKRAMEFALKQAELNIKRAALSQT